MRTTDLFSRSHENRRGTWLTELDGPSLYHSKRHCTRGRVRSLVGGHPVADLHGGPRTETCAGLEGGPRRWRDVRGARGAVSLDYERSNLAVGLQDVRGATPADEPIEVKRGVGVDEGTRGRQITPPPE